MEWVCWIILILIIGAITFIPIRAWRRRELLKEITSLRTQRDALRKEIYEKWGVK